MSTCAAAECSTNKGFQPLLEESKMKTRSNDLKACIKDGIVCSPFPDAHIPDCSWYTFVEKRLLQFGQKAALVRNDDSLTYPETLSLLRRYAAGFQAKGIWRGDRVTCCLSNTPKNFVALHGLIFAGATAILSNPELTAGELTLRVSDSGSKYILTDAEIADKFSGVKSRADIKEFFAVGSVPGFFEVSAFEDITDSSFNEVFVPDPRDELAAICYSSGTTGEPKAVEITHYSCIAGITSLMPSRVFDEDDVFFGCESITHSFGFFYTMFAVCSGATTVMATAEDSIPHNVSVMQRHKVTAVVSFPVILTQIARHVEVSDKTLDSLKKILVTGFVLPTTLGNKLRSTFPLKRFSSVYGLSESLSTMCLPHWDETEFNNIGFPACSVKFKVVDRKTGQPVGPYTKGELHIKSPTFTRGYSRNTGTVSAVNKDGWYESGDLVYYDEDGRFYYCERITNLIKYMDHEIAPSELEDILLSHPSVAEAVVVGMPHPEYFEVAKAFVVLKDSRSAATSPTSEELQEFVAARTAFFKHLHGGVAIVHSIPKTRTGKVKRHQLKETGPPHTYGR